MLIKAHNLKLPVITTVTELTVRMVEKLVKEQEGITILVEW
jgi:hypothetical protein